MHAYTTTQKILQGYDAWKKLPRIQTISPTQTPRPENLKGGPLRFSALWPISDI